jgi:hypothetical protein
VTRAELIAAGLIVPRAHDEITREPAELGAPVLRLDGAGAHEARRAVAARTGDSHALDWEMRRHYIEQRRPRKARP